MILSRKNLEVRVNSTNFAPRNAPGMRVQSKIRGPFVYRLGREIFIL